LAQCLPHRDAYPPAALTSSSAARFGKLKRMIGASSRLWFGKYQLGGILTDDNLFEVTHRLFKPETWIAG
jgi:hypothetical protein